MHFWTLNVEGNTKTIKNPIWNQVYDVLSSVDGGTCSQADLEQEELGCLVVFGGDYEEERGERVFAVNFIQKMIVKEHLNWLCLMLKKKMNTFSSLLKEWV
ncbi:hypothetical protein [Desmospora activa]|uniref:Uncharacterized protein n=1 Tax=Desmospora activa DSM 45169 TaxID=1121389 RepID=A0A2T4Z4K8_9BACL|nr:hypothetical protein [Desmospora activa]PTM56831.1 hypothetical protein C8J48_3156 [Desmospora activa DSM 45169]